MLRAGIDAKVLVITHNVTFDVNITVTLRHPSENDKASSSGYAIVQPGRQASFGVVWQILCF